MSGMVFRSESANTRIIPSSAAPSTNLRRRVPSAIAGQPRPEAPVDPVDSLGPTVTASSAFGEAAWDRQVTANDDDTYELSHVAPSGGWLYSL